jgi:hypothetical protein
MPLARGLLSTDRRIPMKALIAIAATAAATSALALGPLETRSTDSRIDANRRTPQQQ